MDTLQDLLGKVKVLSKDNYDSMDELLTDDVLLEYNNAQLYLCKAGLRNLKQDGRSAYKYAQLAIVLTSENINGYLERGYALFNLNDFQHALEDFNLALNVYKKEPALFFYRGQCFSNLRDYKHAIEAYSVAIQFNSPDYTIPSYYNRGLAKNFLQEYDSAIEDFDKVIAVENQNYRAYCDKGLALFMLTKYDEALKNFNQALEGEPTYPQALYNRGLLHQKRKEYEEAVTNYSSAIENGMQPPSFVTPYAYNNRGNIRMAKEEFDDALADFNAAIKLNPAQAESYLNMGIILEQRLQYADARLAFSKATKIFELNNEQNKIYLNFLEEQIKLCDEKIAEAKELSAVEANDADKKLFSDTGKELDKFIDCIAKKAIPQLKAVVHYTKLLVADIYVNAVESKINYSNAIYMNDPNEGRVLLKYLNNANIRTAFENGEKLSELSVYIGSFLPAEDGETEAGHNDELVMWRTYGRDGKGNEACGCSIIIDSEFFKPPVSLEKQVSGETKDMLCKVIYVQDRAKNQALLADTNLGIETDIEDFKNHLLDIIKLKNNYGAQHAFSVMIDKMVYKKYSKIAYLFKSADYEYEHEVRVIKYVPRNSDTIKFYPIEEKGKPGRLYVESLNSVLPFIEKIYLGPKVMDSTHWSLYLDYQIKQRKNEYKQKKLLNYEKIINTDVEIMKSTNGFV